MSYARIVKRIDVSPIAPCLLDYEAECTEDFWARARDELDRLPGGGLNIAHEAVDRHAVGPLADRLAFRFLSRNDQAHDVSYADLATLTNRFANVLRSLGVGKGDLVCTLAGRIPELYVAALGTLKNGSVFSPLFSAFGPDPIRTRLEIGGARVLLTTESLYRRKVAGIRSRLPELRHVILVSEGQAVLPGTEDYHRLMLSADDDFMVARTTPDDVALVHFTSGTTGRPKGAAHVHDAVVAHGISGKLALDLHPGDVYWCTADPGWVTGTSYGIIAPLVNGVTSIVDEADFDPERWYRILDEQQVSVFYTAPTAIRMLMKAGAELAKAREYPRLRFLASVGEPLNPEGVVWGEEAFGMPFHDNWWQTETGAIMIANFRTMEVRPGSMGRPFPGIEAGLVRRLGSRSVELVEEPGAEGEIALRPGWPSMFRGYLGDPERYAQAFRDGWYLTGDLARRDADGYFWFVGRADDVIKTSGHLIGPFEVESALLEHEAVAEAGVFGRPDPVAGDVVKAVVTLKPGFQPSHQLERALIAHARVRLGAVVAPKEIEFADSLPRTRSGKIMRRLLKARELGLPEGDVSTLEQTQ
jgi:acetyl-CoA synthetase